MKSSEYNLLFKWSKGKEVRINILSIVDTNEGTYISKIASIHNEQTLDSVSRTSIRRHVKKLIKFDLLKVINEGGRPEYLCLSDKGKIAISKLRVERLC